MQDKRKIWIKRGVAASALVAVCAAGATWAVLAADRSPPPPDGPVDAAARRDTVEQVVANLERWYIDPDKAAAVGRTLHAKLAQGAYEKIASGVQFAEVLTDAVQDVTHDRHIEVRYFKDPVTELPAGQESSPEEETAEKLNSLRLNHGFETVGRLRGNIGYIDLHAFGRPGPSAPRIAAAMTLLADTQALIVDLRRCHGGDPETVMQFASYLFDTRTHLNEIWWRDGNTTEERWTTDTVPGTRYGQAKRVFLLTSRETFSAGEDLAYALKNAGRATVIGETTGGGAHPGNPRRLNAHFMMFVPNGRPINPVTHTDWEGVGVAPDVDVSASRALNVAHATALKELAAKETDAQWKDKLERTIHEL